MKRILFLRSSSIILNAMLIAFAFTSCKKQTTDVLAAGPEEVVSAKGKPGTTAEVSLSMTINDAAGNKITSDGGGAYVNGTGNVKVVFDQYGNFMFGAASSSPRVPPMTRYLNINFDNPLSGYSPGGNQKSNFISTITTVTSPNSTSLQNLTVGQTKCIGFSAGISTIESGVLNFHRNSTEDIPTSPTAYIYVTRTSLTEWLMTPVPPLAGGCSTISNVGALRINTVLYGYYNMPFSFTLTKQTTVI